MKHGFVKVGAAVPQVAVASPMQNAEKICECIDRADGCAVLVFPELSVTGCTCGDLFLTDGLYRKTIEAIEKIKNHTAGKKMLVFVGAPVRVNGKMYNCAVALNDGHVAGIVPKNNLSADEMRYFSQYVNREPLMAFCDDSVLVGSACIFQESAVEALKIGCVFGLSSAEHLSLLGADVIVDLAAEPEIIGAEDYRRTAVKASSGSLICAYVYAGAGSGESTTDFVYAGHSMIAENGKLLAENPPFGRDDLITAVIDIQHLSHDRMKLPSCKIDDQWLYAPFSAGITETDITGAVDPNPFMPADADPKAVCARILEIQSHGLAKRIRAAHAKGCVIALSGGLDSTLALIVAVKAADLLGMPRDTVTSVTMPCFGTTSRTRSNAELLALAFGTAFRCVDIKEAVDVHFRDIGHDPENHSVVYENAQARERTQIIMDIANADNSLVIGTGDLSELALGWATYNGDHMSNYGVNGGIPKTLVRRVVGYYADECEKEGNTALAAVFRDVLATPVSPELLPPKDGEIAQRTEDLVGPYELHDFFLYHFVRWGEEPEKILREARTAFCGKFDDETILRWLNTFLRRFHTQQFKRSALPDGPKVGTVGFSPRGDWRMPSDAAVPDTLTL
ncbi:MAG: NAD(+) synthase [Clostridia bacterium]|nr:NAD(+) synthase [Clostridia bacterium]